MKRRLFVLALAALGASVGTGQAADARPNIAACLAAAQTMEVMRQCKRIVSKPCVAEPDYRESTYGLVMCNEREGKVWHALLEARTAQLKKRDPHRAAALQAADSAWRAWLEPECNYHRSEAMGGSAEAVITTECKSDLTAERVILLTHLASAGQRALLDVEARRGRSNGSQGLVRSTFEPIARPAIRTRALHLA